MLTTNYRQRLTWVVVTAILTFQCIAAESIKTVTVTFLDNQQHPLEGAVIVYHSASLLSPTDSSFLVMDQINRQFVPEVLLIREGQSVSFPNSDDIRHHVYSLSRTKRFELKLYSGTDAPPVVFEMPGIVVLGCNIHDQMKGFIYVLAETQHGVISDANGQILLPQDATGISLWHPRLDPIVTKHLDVHPDMSSEMAVVNVPITQTPVEDTSEKPVFGRTKLRSRGHE